MKMSEKLFALMLLVFWNSYGQEHISITESTLKLAFEETKEVYYSFAEGDEIIFNLNMVQGKHIKEVEIIELPNNSVFLEYKAAQIRNRRIKIRNKGLYKFRFYSSSLTNRVCKYSIDRIPASIETTNFNTNWKWLTVKDTIYTSYQKDSLTGYKTVNYQETIRELKSTFKEELLLFDKWQKINSLYRGNKSRNYLRVDIPKDIITNLKEEKVISWAYWIGVGQDSQNAYTENNKSITNLAKGIASNYLSPLGALAMGEVANLISPKTGEDVEYFFISDIQNVELFLTGQQFYLFDQGKGKGAYGMSNSIYNLPFYIGLSNNNELIPIEVNVKVIVVKEIKIFENVVYNRERQEPQYVTLNKTRMDINETQIRVPIE